MYHWFRIIKTESMFKILAPKLWNTINEHFSKSPKPVAQEQDVKVQSAGLHTAEKKATIPMALEQQHIKQNFPSCT